MRVTTRGAGKNLFITLVKDRLERLPKGTVVTEEVKKQEALEALAKWMQWEAIKLLRDHTEPKLGVVLSRMRKLGICIDDITENDRANMKKSIAVEVTHFKSKNPTIKLKKQK